MNPKVLIQITLDDSGNVSCVSNSKNLITILGMIELAKEILTKNKQVKEPSPILVPEHN